MPVVRMCTLVYEFYGNCDDNDDSTYLSHWTGPHALINHTIAAMMASLTANRNEVLPTQNLLFSSGHLFTHEGYVNEAPAHVYKAPVYKTL